jgi:hypothetical protein
MRSGYEVPSYASIDVATAATSTLVAAATGKRVKVIGFWLIAGGTTTVTFKDDTTALHGGIPLTAQAGLVVMGNRDTAAFVTTAGNALKFTNGSAQQVSGVVIYTVEADTPAPGTYRGA